MGHRRNLRKSLLILAFLIITFQNSIKNIRTRNILEVHVCVDEKWLPFAKALIRFRDLKVWFPLGYCHSADGHKWPLRVNCSSSVISYIGDKTINLHQKLSVRFFSFRKPQTVPIETGNSGPCTFCQIKFQLLRMNWSRISVICIRNLLPKEFCSWACRCRSRSACSASRLSLVPELRIYVCPRVNFHRIPKPQSDSVPEQRISVVPNRADKYTGNILRIISVSS